MALPESRPCRTSSPHRRPRSRGVRERVGQVRAATLAARRWLSMRQCSHHPPRLMTVTTESSRERTHFEYRPRKVLEGARGKDQAGASFAWTGRGGRAFSFSSSARRSGRVVTAVLLVKESRAIDREEP